MTVRLSPPLQRVTDDIGQRPLREQHPEGFLSHNDTVPSLPGARSESISPNISSGHRRHERREFTASSIDCLPGFDDSLVAVGHRDRPAGHVRQRDFRDVPVQQRERDRGRLRTLSPTAFAGPAGVDLAGRSASAHDVPAARAPHQASEQRRRTASLRWPWSQDLGGLELVDSDDRGMRHDVDVRPNSQFSEIHAIPQQLAGAARSHPECPGDAGQRVAAPARKERVPHHRRICIGHQAPGRWVARVATRRLPRLPDPRVGSPLPELVEPFDMPLSFGGVHCRLEAAQHAAVRSGRVERIVSGDDHASGRFYATPDLFFDLDVASDPRLVREHYSGVPPVLNAFYGEAKGRSFVEGPAAGDIKLGRQDLEWMSGAFRGKVQSGELVAFAVEVGVVGFASAHVADANDSGEGSGVHLHLMVTYTTGTSSALSTQALKVNEKAPRAANAGASHEPQEGP